MLEAFCRNAAPLKSPFLIHSSCCVLWSILKEYKAWQNSGPGKGDETLTQGDIEPTKTSQYPASALLFPPSKPEAYSTQTHQTEDRFGMHHQRDTGQTAADHKRALRSPVENTHKGTEKSSKETSRNSRIHGLAEEEEPAVTSKYRFFVQQHKVL